MLDSTRPPSVKPSPVYIGSSSPSSPPPNWWVNHLLLKVQDKEILESGGWLNDRHIAAAQCLLKKQYPLIDGLQDPVLGSRLIFSVMLSEGIQIINHHQKHWTCISTIGCQPGHVDVYDCLYSTLSPSAVQQICNLLHTNQSKLTVRMQDVQIQSGGGDCGLFSIASAVCLCQGKDPCKFSWTQELMRKHLAACLSHQRLMLFPGKSRKVSVKIKRTILIPVFCSCRMPENKMGMVQCSLCEERHH